MITGAHTIILTKEAEAVRTMFRDVLGFPAVDAGGGWLIFALPPAELAAHPADEADRYELYLMCDDIRATVGELERKGVEFSRPISEEDFGLLTAIKLPGGGDLGLYEPRHPIPPPAGWVADQAAAIVSDCDGEIVSWNAAAEALLGYSAGEVIGRRVDLLIPGACKQRHWADYDRAVASGRLANSPTGDGRDDP